MIKHILYCFLLLPVVSYTQEIEEPYIATIQTEIYNPTDYDLTLIIKFRNGYTDMRDIQIITIKANDTTALPKKFELDENQVPQNVYRFSIYEAPSYYQINDHYHFECERLVDEDYYCLHVIEESIYVDTTVVFDVDQFKREERKNAPLHEGAYLEQQPEYDGELTEMMKSIQDSVQFKHEDIRIFVEFVSEMDSTVTDVKVIKSSHEEYDEAVIKYFEKLRFVPGQYNGEAVRSKMVIPIRVQ